MKRVFWLIIIMLGISACSTFSSKLMPEHSGVDSELESMVDQYLWLSAQYGLTFNNKVTVGFKDIKIDGVAGQCNYGIGWREIDIDRSYWSTIGPSQRIALMYHELTHCYCNRNHDYSKNKAYPSTAQGRLDEAKEWVKKGGMRPGHYEDGCPTSLMYPSVVDKDCTLSHYGEYVKEMFDRCSPW